MTSNERTLKRCRQSGHTAAVVEKFNPHVGKFGVRQDLFSIIDVIALDHDRGIIGIQACTGSSYQEHIRKLTRQEAARSRDWLKTPGAILEIWGWRKIKVRRGGKAVVWKPRIKEITLEDLA